MVEDEVLAGSSPSPPSRGAAAEPRKSSEKTEEAADTTSAQHSDDVSGGDETASTDTEEVQRTPLLAIQDVEENRTAPADRTAARPTDNATICSGAEKKRQQPQQTYKLKDVEWVDTTTRRERSVKIVTQNENGPCPLIALANVLALRGDVVVASAQAGSITDTELVELLGDYLVQTSVEPRDEFGGPDESSYGIAGNTESTHDDLANNLELLPTLSRGLDVDLQFSHIYDFAESPAGQLFKAFGVDLVHGWVVDPEHSRDVASILMKECRNSYEGAVEFILSSDEVDRQADEDSNGLHVGGAPPRRMSLIDRLAINPRAAEEEAAEQRRAQAENAAKVNQWMAKSATQLTEFGLGMLGTMLPEMHLCVLFRNNHFSTLFKRRQGELFILCTDDGMVGDDRIVWESLRDVHQMTSEFLDARFSRVIGGSGKDMDSRAAAVSSSSAAAASKGKMAVVGGDYVQEKHETTTSAEQMDRDFAFALSLQDEEDRKHNSGEGKDGAMRHRQSVGSALQLRQSDKLPPGMDVRSGHLYGVPMVTKEGERKLAHAIFRTKSDENFSRQMADTFLPHEVAAKSAAKPTAVAQTSRPRNTRDDNSAGARKPTEDKCIIC